MLKITVKTKVPSDHPYLYTQNPILYPQPEG